MRHLSVLGLFLIGVWLHAGPTDAAIVAAMKLPDAPNYAWVTTVVDDARTYDITGQTDKSDFSLVTMPMVSAVRRRAGRGSANSDNQVEAVFLGAERCVISTPEGWRTPEELKSAASSERSGPYPGGPGGGSGIGFPGNNSRGRGRRGGPPQAYSNLQLNLSRPHEEIGVIVGSHTDIKAEGEIVSGTLSDTGAKLLLVHAGQNELTPLSAAGTFRLWIRDGALVKYEVTLTGKIAVETPNARREVEVNQTSTTELRAVGTTKFEIPAEARKKLGG
jgi:hypothetical protein